MGKTFIRTVLMATTASVGLAAIPARAQTSAVQIDRIERQIQALQNELKRVRQDLAARDVQVRAAQAEASRARQLAASRPVAPLSGQPNAPQSLSATAVPGAQAQSLPSGAPGPHAPETAGGQAASAQSPMGTFRLGGVTVTLGGFIATEGIYRTRNETADLASNFTTGIPFPQSANYHTGEFRGSARQSRLSLLIQGNATPSLHLAGYYETDFLSAGTTSNSTQSNSYTLRLRQAYATLDQTDWGLHVLGGQAWSLMTLNRVGITPRQENVPLTIDAQYVPGFNWARQWQLRVAKDFDDHRVWLGASIEAPQASFYTGPNGLGVLNGTATLTNAGGSQLNATSNYSDDIAPDVVAKAAWDPGFGHYEAFGVARLLHDRVSVVGEGHNNTVLAGGVGGGLILPLVPKMLDFQLSGMAGYGIGRYGTSGLPDAIVSQTGAPVPIPEYMLLAGLVAHPVANVDVYAYAGTEQEGRRSFTESGKGYGYGSPLYSNAGCGTELSTATCTGNTSGVVQGTLGAWWRFLRGEYGTMQVGAQYSYTRRSTFPGTTTTRGNAAPSTDENIAMFSFRYLPFQ